MAELLCFVISFTTTTFLTIPSPSFALSPSQNQDFQILDISASLTQARQLFSKSKASAISPPFPISTRENHNSNNTFSLSLHPRSSLFPPHSVHQNYTSLTLSRLSPDAARLSQLESAVISGISQGSGDYFTRIGVGTPLEDLYFAIDTGSDLTWLQCKPCIDCYKQNGSIFNPAASSTYHPVNCNSNLCYSLDVSACSRDNTCLYQVAYGDGSYTVGEFATETLSFGSSGSVPNVALGCGHDNEGLFSGSTGLMGLGGGSLSIPSQIKATSFSYCLVDRDSTSSSTLEFNSAQPNDSVLAPILKNSAISTYYYVGLTGFSVGGKPLNLSASLFHIGNNGKGGVIVDSGTAVTHLRTEVYNALRDAFVELSRDLLPPQSTGFALFDTCYSFGSMTRVRVPTVSFLFAGGKTLPLRPSNYIIPVDDEGKFCLAFAPTSGQLSIIGNVQQQGTRVTYNLASKTVGFSPNKC